MGEPIKRPSRVISSEEGKNTLGIVGPDPTGRMGSLYLIQARDPIGDKTSQVIIDAREIDDLHAFRLDHPQAGHETNDSEGRRLIGFQLADETGRNIAGDDADPSGFASFEVIHPADAALVMAAHPTHLLQPIFDGDVEEASVVRFPRR